jgi:hypothetical protein
MQPLSLVDVPIPEVGSTLFDHLAGGEAMPPSQAKHTELPASEVRQTLKGRAVFANRPP